MKTAQRATTSDVALLAKPTKIGEARMYVYLCSGEVEVVDADCIRLGEHDLKLVCSGCGNMVRFARAQIYVCSTVKDLPPVPA